MYLHKCKLKSFKKRYHEKFEDVWQLKCNSFQCLYSLLVRLHSTTSAKSLKIFQSSPRPNPDLLLHVFRLFFFVTSGLEVLFHYVARWHFCDRWFFVIRRDSLLWRRIFSCALKCKTVVVNQYFYPRNILINVCLCNDFQWVKKIKRIDYWIKYHFVETNFKMLNLRYTRQSEFWRFRHRSFHSTDNRATHHNFLVMLGATHLIPKKNKHTKTVRKSR